MRLQDTHYEKIGDSLGHCVDPMGKNSSKMLRMHIYHYSYYYLIYITFKKVKIPEINKCEFLKIGREVKMVVQIITEELLVILLGFWS